MTIFDSSGRFDLEKITTIGFTALGAGFGLFVGMGNMPDGKSLAGSIIN